MARAAWVCGFIVLVAVALFPFVPEASVEAKVREVPTQRAAKLSLSAVWSEEQDDVIRIKGPLRIAIEGRLRWLGLI